jgi:hypothetical protein
VAGRLRSLRIADEVWVPAMARARREGTSLTAVVVKFLTRYGRG